MKLIINQVEYEAEDGDSVLEVARKNDIWIPALCYHEHLSSYGACRLCLVEFIRRGRSKVTTSCTLPAQDGMEIITNSDRLERLRGLNMELILANCPESEAVGEMAGRLSVKGGRFQVNEGNDCILCGMCARACAQISGAEAISFVDRGVDRKISTPFGQPSPDCVLCGACVSVCPTGSRLLDLAKISGEEPQKLLSRFDADVAETRAIERPYAQAVPNVPAINPEVCLKLNKDACGICEKVCEAGAIQYDQQDETRDIDVGAVVVLPGFEDFMAGQEFDFGYSRYDDVVTSMQFERILSASGPFGGHVRRLSDGKEPQKIAFLQCVGSRDIACRNDYCSSVCCMYAIKEAVIVKEHLKDVDVTIFFMDMRAFGKEFDKYYERAKSEYGVNFKRARVSDVTEIDGRLQVQFSPDTGGVDEEQFDMVVLSTGMEMGEKSSELAKKLGVKLEPHGFIWTDPSDPLQTSREGIFVGGAASGPKDIPETVTQASGTASRVSRLLAEARGTLTTEQEFPPERDVTAEPPRIGVFVCHCGINIGNVVNVPGAVEHVKRLPYVVYAEENLYTCSQDTQEHIKDIVQEHDLNRVVVASCSPRTHEPLFQQTLREAGLNPHLFEMANIRDQCSWVHMSSPDKASEKANSLVGMAIAKVTQAKALHTESLPITPSALVVGGGLAGMTAAVAIAEAGFDVTLVERRKSLGGNLKKLRHSFSEPSIKAYLKQFIRKVQDHQRITVYVGAEIEHVEGFVGNFESTVRVGSEEVKIKHGVVVVATGGNEHKPAEYMCGDDKRVLTQLQLEDLLWKKNSIDDIKSVVMIQCVGSREQGHMYCSRVCCSTAVKNALRIKELSPETDISILYRDMRTYSFSEKYFQQARDKGITFVRYTEDDKPVVTKDGDLSVAVYEPLLARQLILDADLLVLSSRIDAPADNGKLAQLLKVPLNEDGFFLEAHAKLRPVEFATEGVFVAGLAHGPKSMPETIAQAEAAASKACTILTKETYQGESKIACVDANRCAACGTCVHVCAYGAIEVAVVDDRTGALSAVVNPALCKGCGTCAATCRSGAVDVNGINDRQIDLMIKAI